MNVRELIEDDLAEETIVLDDLDEAVIGLSVDGNVIYSVSKVIYCLMDLYDWEEEDAWDHFSYNINGTMYDSTKISPIFLVDREYKHLDSASEKISETTSYLYFGEEKGVF